MNFLQSLFAPAQPPGIPAAHTFTPEQDRAAQAHGFKDANQMILWQRQRDTPSGGTVQGHGPASMDAFMSWHPANILSKISAALNAATGN